MLWVLWKLDNVMMDWCSDGCVYCMVVFFYVFFFKQKTAYEISACLVGSENVYKRQTQSIKSQQLTKSVTSIWSRNINLVSIVYGSRPRLRDRLTLRGLTLRRNPWIFGDRVFHSVNRYLCQHSHFWYLQDPSRVSLYRLTERSATRYNFRRNYKSTDSVHDLSPVTSLAQKLY